MSRISTTNNKPAKYSDIGVRWQSIERGLEIMAEDEYLEVTPENVRLRKQLLSETERVKAGRKK